MGQPAANTMNVPDTDGGRCGEQLHQTVGEWRADHGAAAKAHDGHADRHAAPVGERLDEGRDRGDVRGPTPAAWASVWLGNRRIVPFLLRFAPLCSIHKGLTGEEPCGV